MSLAEVEGLRGGEARSTAGEEGQGTVSPRKTRGSK